MRRVLSSVRRRATLFSLAGVALVAAVVTGFLVINTGPATAHWQSLSGSPTCDCVRKNAETGQYQAVFGYESTSKSAGRIEAGDNNRLVASGGTVRGTVTTEFAPGSHKATFATGWVSKDTTVSWQVGGKTVAADWNKPTCGRDVSLPATGNGSGPLLALFVSLLIAGGALVVRRRRATVRAL